MKFDPLNRDHLRDLPGRIPALATLVGACAHGCLVYWVEQLIRDAVSDEVFDGSAPNRTTAQRAKINEELYQRLIALADNGSPPDRVVAAQLDHAMTDLTSGTGGRYDTTRDAVAAPMRLAAVRRVGVPTALGQLHAAYVLEVTDTHVQLVSGTFERRD